ncbi:MAG: hypothetical protein RLN60_00050 [Phycisphaerales bacterium]
MGKRRGPALYELVRVRQRGGPFAEGQPSYAPKEEGGEEASGLLASGRTIRMPVGYVFLAIGVGIALLFGGYFIGYFTRDREIRADKTTEARNDLAGIQDPTLDNVPVREGLINDARNAPRGGQSTQPVLSGPLPNPYLVDAWADDPRVEGMNYYIVATQALEEANRVAAFLAEAGLEVARLPVDNRGLAIVIVREPFAPGEVSSPRSQALESQIKRLGREFKRDHGGARDFRDAYLSKYR